MSTRRNNLISSHSLQGTLWFRFRVRGNQVRRTLQNLTHPVPLHKPNPAKSENLSQIAESRSPLWTNPDPKEQLLTLGKIENLRIALKNWHGITIPAGQTVSFWRQTGSPHKHRGFVPGRELREGCIVPSPGGGLCQLSNALYDLALRTGCDILERHPHTQVIPGSATSRDHDATVAFNHIDLRFRPKTALRITAEITGDELMLRFHTEPNQHIGDQRKNLVNLTITNSSPQSCATCGADSCIQHEFADSVFSKIPDAQNTFLIDAPSPEISLHLVNTAQPNDTILSSIQSKSQRFDRYRLPDIQANHGHAPIPTIARALQVRSAKKPPDTRKALLDGTQKIAQTLAKKVPYTSRKLIVDIAFLPYLDPFVLQGRDVAVYVSRFPLKLIHGLLDEAALALPNSPQLCDFRASPELVEAEWAALQNANEIITSHAFLAQSLGLSGFKTITVLPYKLPSKEHKASPVKTPYLFFPGPTVSRKGAHAVREVALATNLPIALAGKNLERPDFWNGIEILDAPEYPAHQAVAVIAPAVYEDRPGRLLQSFVDGTPIITTAACGLPESPHVLTTEFNNHACMAEYVRNLLS